jgi:phosphogluconate dehydratase
VLSCGNLAHGFAVCSPAEKAALAADVVPNLGIITAYNDMLSAHQPYETFPALIREAAREVGGVAQVAGGVPAMCDGVTQGQPGMELSLFSRDLRSPWLQASACRTTCSTRPSISASVTRSSPAWIAALTFGHLPAVFIPSRSHDVGPAQ